MIWNRKKKESPKPPEGKWIVNGMEQPKFVVGNFEPCFRTIRKLEIYDSYYYPYDTHNCEDVWDTEQEALAELLHRQNQELLEKKAKSFETLKKLEGMGK